MSETNRNLKAFTVMFRAYQAVQDATKRGMQTCGINQTEFAVLELLYHKGEQPIQVIGNKILIASSSITYVVDKLVEKSYVSRRSCEKDRRVTYTVLTAEGEQLMARLFPKHEQKINKIFEDLQEHEVEQMIELLKRVGYNAEKQ
ncbi:MAG: MarR family transcriptional regulator [Lysinibacillus sp.]